MRVCTTLVRVSEAQINDSDYFIDLKELDSKWLDFEKEESFTEMNALPP